MLISFSVENFKSIRDEVKLVMAPSATIKEHQGYIIQTGDETVPELLPVQAIYGLNGSGKSTLLKAASFMRGFVLTSAKESTLGDKIPVEPFRLDNDSSTAPTSFGIEFIVESIRYLYRFSVTPNRVTYEALHAFPKGVKQTWFERSYKAETDSYAWKFSFTHYKGGKAGHHTTTLENTLYLSKAVMNNDEQLKVVHSFFGQKLFVSSSNPDPNLTYDYFLNSEDGPKKVMDFLRDADLGIDNITVEKNEVSTDGLPGEIRNRLPGKYISYNIKSHHMIPGTNQLVSFSLERNESAGTIKMFRMAGLILKTLSEGATLLIDEPDQGLHFKLQCYLIGLFNKGKGNKQAQLIFSTHSPILLDNDFLRRDQVWFTSKSENKNTILYSLIDVPKNVKEGKPVRKGQDLMRGFLDGKFYDPPKFGTQLNLFEEE